VTLHSFESEIETLNELLGVMDCSDRVTFAVMDALFGKKVGDSLSLIDTVAELLLVGASLLSDGDEENVSSCVMECDVEAVKDGEDVTLSECTAEALKETVGVSSGGILMLSE